MKRKEYQRPDAKPLIIGNMAINCTSGNYTNSAVEDVTIEDEYEW